jgi:hypothetical protein
MLCLYSSPEVISLEVKPRVKRLELSVSWLLRIVRRAFPARALPAQALCGSTSYGFCHTSQSTKTRSPAIQRNRAGCIKLFSLPKQAQLQAKSRPLT